MWRTIFYGALRAAIRTLRSLVGVGMRVAVLFIFAIIYDRHRFYLSVWRGARLLDFPVILYIMTRHGKFRVCFIVHVLCYRMR